MKRTHLARDIVEVLVLALILFVVMRFSVQSYYVDKVTMAPTLAKDDYVLVNKLAYLFRTPQRGDVIVFHFPQDTTKDYIKRIIGIPGDVIKTDSSRVWVNGVLLNEHAYVNTPANATANVWTVGKSQYFVMGDNRPASDDSRSWGFVPRDYIIGKAAFVYWPMNKWQGIDSYQSVFSQVKPNN